MWMKSHKWVNHPYTVYEIRRELRVRECRQTAMVFDKKYQNIDTGKFNIDKLYTLNSCSLHDIMIDEYDDRISLKYFRKEKSYYHAEEFIPKDNDFDEECRIDEERKKKELEILSNKKAKKEECKSNIIDAKKDIELEDLIKKREELKESIERKEKEYQVLLSQAKIRAKMLNGHRYLSNNVQELSYSNIRPNKWIVK